MKDRNYYIQKAKRERGLTDEEIQFFLDRHPRWDLLPVYARFVRKLGIEGALNVVLNEYDDGFDEEFFNETFNWDVEAPKGPELSPGKPETCLGGFEQNQDNHFENVQCENCDYYLACFPEEMLSSNG